MITLDVGCGSNATGDVNCDLQLKDSDQKWDLIPHCQNFVRADVRFLPFRSESFKIVYCSHVLEHLDDPIEALRELKRVSSTYVVVILPFGLFSVFDVFYCGRKFGDHIRWLRKHHKHFFLMDPLHTGSFKLMFASLPAALKYRKKVFEGWLRIPMPFQTLTVIEVKKDA